MEKVYEQAKDLHIRNFVVYGKAADSKLYYESNYTTQVGKEVAEDAFKKGSLLIVDDGKYFIPVALNGTKVYTVNAATTAALTEWAVAAAASSN